jgi:hypothetical protein
LTEPTEGILRVFRDVIVRREGLEEWVAISREGATVGETLVLDVDEGEQQVTVYVIESRPIIVDGDMRHRIRLQAGDMPPILFEQQVRRG